LIIINAVGEVVLVIALDDQVKSIVILIRFLKVGNESLVRF